MKTKFSGHIVLPSPILTLVVMKREEADELVRKLSSMGFVVIVDEEKNTILVPILNLMIGICDESKNKEGMQGDSTQVVRT